MGKAKLIGNPLQNRKGKRSPKTSLFLDQAEKLTREACWNEKLSEADAQQTILQLTKLRECVDHRPN